MSFSPEVLSLVAFVHAPPICLLTDLVVVRGESMVGEEVLKVLRALSGAEGEGEEEHEVVAERAFAEVEGGLYLTVLDLYSKRKSDYTVFKPIRKPTDNIQERNRRFRIRSCYSRRGRQSVKS